eukprot:scaffold533536_cov19-Prasinocladus_malaysianus.AAC.1
MACAPLIFEHQFANRVSPVPAMSGRLPYLYRWCVLLYVGNYTFIQWKQQEEHREYYWTLIILQFNASRKECARCRHPECDEFMIHRIDPLPFIKYYLILLKNAMSAVAKFGS